MLEHSNDSEKPSGLKIVFFGTPQFAAYILEYLVAHGENIVCVVTTSEKEQGRGLKTRPAVLQEKAVELGIPFLAPKKVRDPEFIEQLRTFGADCFCVVAYKILPKEIYAMPKLGTFNVHTSLLPKYRGAAPMHRAIINGERETGITTFLLDEQIDTGGILLQEKIPITENETVGELHDELMHLGAKLALGTLRGLSNGSLHPQMQNTADATPAPKIFPEDCIIDFNRTAEQVHNQIRGLSPSPGAVTIFPSGERMKIYRTVIEHSDWKLPSSEFGSSIDKRKLYIGTATLPIEILELQREGKKKMSAEEFLRGTRIPITNKPDQC